MFHSLKTKVFLLFTLLIIFALSLVGWYGFKSAKEAYISTAISANDIITESLSQSIISTLNDVTQDALYESEHYTLKKLLIWKRLKYEERIQYWKNLYIETTKDYMKKKRAFHKVYVIDKYGKEIVSLLYNDKKREVINLDTSSLKNLSKNDYFQVAKKLKKEQFYVSNVVQYYSANGLKNIPIIHFSTPIIDDNGEFQGVFVIDYRIDMLFHAIQKFEKKKNTAEIYIISRDGTYLYHPNGRENSSTFQEEYADIFTKIIKEKNLTGIQNNRLYSADRIEITAAVNGNNNFYIISMTKSENSFEALHNFTTIFSTILLAVILLTFFIAHYYINKIVSPLQKVSKQLKSLSLGVITKEKVEYNKKDEIGDIVISTNVLIEAIEATIMQADAIANGDFTKEITLLSNRDALGLSLTQMTERLKDIALLATSLSSGDYNVTLLPKGNHDKLGIALMDLVAYFEKITTMAESIAQGKLELYYKTKGEDDRLGYALLEMIEYLKELLHQAQNITNGNFSSNIKLKSSDDALGAALLTMTHSLQKSETQNKKEIFLSEGVTKINENIVGIDDVTTLSKAFITTLCRYIGANSGTLYHYSEEKEELYLVASFAYTVRETTRNRFKIGEGVIGQVALEKEAILLKNIEDSSFAFESGTTIAQSKEIYTFPALYNKKLIAVIEIMSFEHFTPLMQEYLQNSLSIYINSFNTIIQNSKIRELLAKSQEAFEELQVQSEELQETNTQMEEQQQQLNAQAETLKENNYKLTQAKEEINQRAKDLERASRYKNEFLANMSHELRTPLNSIILLSKLLHQDSANELSQKDREKVSVINKAGNDLLLLINDILDLSKVESGKMELSLQEVSSEEIIQEQRGLFESIAAEKGVEFVTEDHFESLFITDKTKLSQVVKNLLSNAFKFTKEGSVHFSIDTQEEEILFCVSDSGIGIPEDKLETIFEAFKQVDGSISREYGGTGLGLSISKTIVELLGGSIHVTSQLGKGATFTVRLPKRESEEVTLIKNQEQEKQIAEEESQSQLIIEASSNSSDITDSFLQEKNILIVDDDSRNIFSLTSLLEDVGAEVWSAFNGKDAIDLLREDSKAIDIILMDIMMPTMDGLETIRAIKADETLKNIPIIAITARRMPKDKEECLAAGASGYLAKPINEEQLFSLLKRWVE